MKIVKMKKSWGCNNAGETCGFEDAVAEILTKSGTAVLVGDGKPVEKPSKK